MQRYVCVCAGACACVCARASQMSALCLFFLTYLPVSPYMDAREAGSFKVEKVIIMQIGFRPVFINIFVRFYFRTVVCNQLRNT